MSDYNDIIELYLVIRFKFYFKLFWGTVDGALEKQSSFNLNYLNTSNSLDCQIKHTYDSFNRWSGNMTISVHPFLVLPCKSVDRKKYKYSLYSFEQL